MKAHDARTRPIGQMPRAMSMATNVVTLVAFLFNLSLVDPAFAAKSVSAPAAQAAGASAMMNGREPLTADTVSIPYRFGEIKDLTKGTNGKTIVHIQDAHCNYACQHSIEGIIGHLKNAYTNVRIISLEGGKGRYDLSSLTGIADADIRAKVADYFVKEGLVSGAEYYAATNPGAVELFGIEDEALYKENLGAYRGTLPYKAEIDKSLNVLLHAVVALKSRVYSKEMQAVDTMIREYKTDAIDFKAHIMGLQARAAAVGLDLAPYKGLTALVSVLGEEKGIDFTKAEKERAVLIDGLNKKLSKAALADLLMKSVQFKAGEISSDDFYGYLFKKARFARVDFATLPNLVKYADYLAKYEAIDKRVIFNDMRALEKALMMRLASTDDERALYTLDTDLAIMRGIFSIALVKDDFEYYLAHKADFAAKRFIDFINAKAPVYGFDRTIAPEVSKLDTYRADMEKFYLCSLKRDDAFLKNIAARMDQAKETVTVLVTGGFHTGNLAELFKKAGYTYVQVMPKFQKGDGECPYMRLLAGGESALGALMIRALTPPQSTIAIASMYSEMGMTPVDRSFADLMTATLEALESDPENGMMILLIDKDTHEPLGGYYRLSYTKSEYSEPFGEVNGKTVYAQRQGIETLDTGSFAAVTVDPARATAVGRERTHQLYDLLLVMAHDNRYPGLEAVTLDASPAWAAVSAKLREKGVSQTNIDRIARLSGDGALSIKVVTGQARALLPWAIGSYSDGYGVNLAYARARDSAGRPTGEFDVGWFVDALIHELNRASIPGLSHASNNPALNDAYITAMLDRIDGRVPGLLAGRATRRGDPNMAGGRQVLAAAPRLVERTLTAANRIIEDFTRDRGVVFAEMVSKAVNEAVRDQAAPERMKNFIASVDAGIRDMMHQTYALSLPNLLDEDGLKFSVQDNGDIKLFNVTIARKRDDGVITAVALLPGEMRALAASVARHIEELRLPVIAPRLAERTLTAASRIIKDFAKDRGVVFAEMVSKAVNEAVRDQAAPERMKKFIASVDAGIRGMMHQTYVLSLPNFLDEDELKFSVQGNDIKLFGVTVAQRQADGTIAAVTLPANAMAALAANMIQYVAELLKPERGDPNMVGGRQVPAEEAAVRRWREEQSGVARKLRTDLANEPEVIRSIGTSLSFSIEEFIREVSRYPGYGAYAVTVEPLSKAGDSATLTVTVSNSEGRQLASMVVKVTNYMNPASARLEVISDGVTSLRTMAATVSGLPAVGYKIITSLQDDAVRTAFREITGKELTAGEEGRLPSIRAAVGRDATPEDLARALVRSIRTEAEASAAETVTRRLMQTVLHRSAGEEVSDSEVRHMLGTQEDQLRELMRMADIEQALGKPAMSDESYYDSIQAFKDGEALDIATAAQRVRDGVTIPSGTRPPALSGDEARRVLADITGTIEAFENSVTSANKSSAFNTIMSAVRRGLVRVINGASNYPAFAGLTIAIDKVFDGVDQGSQTPRLTFTITLTDAAGTKIESQEITIKKIDGEFRQDRSVDGQMRMLNAMISPVESLEFGEEMIADSNRAAAKEVFRQITGRDLTPDEEMYLPQARADISRSDPARAAREMAQRAVQVIGQRAEDARLKTFVGTLLEALLGRAPTSDEVGYIEQSGREGKVSLALARLIAINEARGGIGATWEDLYDVIGKLDSGDALTVADALASLRGDTNMAGGRQLPAGLVTDIMARGTLSAIGDARQISWSADRRSVRIEQTTIYGNSMMGVAVAYDRPIDLIALSNGGVLSVDATNLIDTASLVLTDAGGRQMRIPYQSERGWVVPVTGVSETIDMTAIVSISIVIENGAATALMTMPIDVRIGVSPLTATAAPIAETQLPAGPVEDIMSLGRPSGVTERGLGPTVITLDGGRAMRLETSTIDERSWQGAEIVYEVPIDLNALSNGTLVVETTDLPDGASLVLRTARAAIRIPYQSGRGWVIPIASIGEMIDVTAITAIGIVIENSAAIPLKTMPIDVRIGVSPLTATAAPIAETQLPTGSVADIMARGTLSSVGDVSRLSWSADRRSVRIEQTTIYGNSMMGAGIAYDRPIDLIALSNGGVLSVDATNLIDTASLVLTDAGGRQMRIPYQSERGWVVPVTGVSETIDMTAIVSISIVIENGAATALMTMPIDVRIGVSVAARGDTNMAGGRRAGRAVDVSSDGKKVAMNAGAAMTAIDAVKDEMKAAFTVIDEGLGKDLYEGGECYVAVLGAEPVGVGGVTKSTMTGLRSAIEQYAQKRQVGNVNFRFGMGADDAVKALTELKAKGKAMRERMRLQISATLFADARIQALFGVTTAEALEAALGECFMLSVVRNDRQVVGGKPVTAPLSYGKLAAEGIATLNAADYYARERAKNVAHADIIADPAYLACVASWARCTNLITNREYEEILAEMNELIARSDGQNVFATKTFEMFLPPITPADVQEIAARFKTELEVLRAL